MADIKIYGKLVNATESGKIANYSQIDGTPDITEVEANPTGSGTENLTRLKVGDIVYNVPQGGTALNLENGEGEGSLSQIYLQGGKNINKAESQGSIALGYGVTVQKSSVTNETGFCGYAEGGGTITEGQFGHAEGEMTKALARGSHSEGKKTEALGMYCHVEGSENIAGFEDISKEYGDQAAHAEGMLNKAKGRYSHAEGKNNIVGNGSGNGESSHAEGENNTVMGNFSHVEGYNNTVNGNYTHVEGSGNSVSATTNNGHVEGFKNTISSNYGHVGGLSSEVSGTGAFAHGNGVKANKWFQTVFGQFNNPNTKDNEQTAIFQVGVGKSEDARTNAFEILWDGRAKVLTAPKSENDVVRKKELDKKLTAPATPTANSVVTISANGAVATKPLSEIGGGGGGGSFDPTKYYTKTETDGLLNEKQDDLTQTQLNAVNSGITANKVSTYDGYATAINNKVDKVTGKGLSTNDFTDAEKTKLAGIETGAEVNEIDTITAGENVTVSKSGKTVTISATGGGGGVNVVQTTGQSTTAVMSQKAVTDKLDGKASTSYVQGNPTASGTVDLTRLKVGNTVYNVPHGIKALKVTIW